MLDLSRNENPIEPSPTITRAIFQGAFEANRFPDEHAVALREAIAAMHDLDAACVAIGCGVGELIDIAASMAMEDGGEAVIGFPASPLHERAVLHAGGEARRVPLHNWRNDLAAMRDQVTPRTKLLVLGNPNDPTGTTVRGDDLARFLDQLPDRLTVVVDESYVEYVAEEGFCSALGFTGAHPGLLVMRTFAYAYGLAGLGLGYLVAGSALAARIEEARSAEPVGRIAQAAAIAALADDAQLEKTLWTNRAARQVLCERLDGMGLEYIPSQANFVLVRVFDGQEIADALLELGIRVLPMRAYGLRDYIRITVGTADEMHRVSDRLAALCSGESMRIASRLHTALGAFSTREE